VLSLGDPNLRAEIEKRALDAARTLRFADLSPMADEEHVKGVNMFWWNELLELRVGLFGCYSRGDQTQPQADAVHMGVNRQRRLATREEKHARGGLRSNAAERSQKSAAFLHWNLA
jgi:hypothetical protein